jgi:hypothetical protein
MITEQGRGSCGSRCSVAVAEEEERYRWRVIHALHAYVSLALASTPCRGAVG